MATTPQNTFDVCVCVCVCVWRGGGEIQVLAVHYLKQKHRSLPCTTKDRDTGLAVHYHKRAILFRYCFMFINGLFLVSVRSPYKYFIGSFSMLCGTDEPEA